MAFEGHGGGEIERRDSSSDLVKESSFSELLNDPTPNMSLHITRITRTLKQTRFAFVCQICQMCQKAFVLLIRYWARASMHQGTP